MNFFLILFFFPFLLFFLFFFLFICFVASFVYERETYGCNDRTRMRIIYYFYRGSLTVAIFLPERSIDGGRMGGLFSRERLGEVCEAICMVFVPGWNDCVPCCSRAWSFV